MDHLSEVAQIIGHAVTGNAEGVQNYGRLLAEKLRQDGEDRQADIIERKLSGAPPAPEECLIPLALEATAPGLKQVATQLRDALTDLVYAGNCCGAAVVPLRPQLDAGAVAIDVANKVL